MFPLLPPSSAFYENSQDEYPADGPHNVSSRTMTARTVTMSQPPPAAPPPRPPPQRPPEASQGDTAPVVDDEQPTPVCYACRILAHADAALGHAIALGYAQGPGAWGANEIIMPDGARFSMLEADPMKLTYY